MLVYADQFFFYPSNSTNLMVFDGASRLLMIDPNLARSLGTFRVLISLIWLKFLLFRVYLEANMGLDKRQ